MTSIDQFESAFKAAVKEEFVYQPIPIQSILVVTDLVDDSVAFSDKVRMLLRTIIDRNSANLRIVRGDEFNTIGELLEIVDQTRPDIICTYRNLKSTAWQWPYSLGDYLDVLTQLLAPPVLVMPHPSECKDFNPRRGTQTTMAITDHLANDHRLVNYAAAMVQTEGMLLLTHVEDTLALERCINTISKLPELDTDVAREEIPHQLLKEPHDYITSCRSVLDQQGLQLTVEEFVELGHLLNDHRRIVEEHNVDLLVLNTKDDDQTAMHGLAYPLSVELRNIPLLML